MTAHVRTTHRGMLAALMGEVEGAMASYAQGMLYELARELISSRIGNLSHRIGVEETRPVPRESRIVRLERLIVAFARMRDGLEPEDDASVRRVLDRYSRQPLTLPAISH